MTPTDFHLEKARRIVRAFVRRAFSSVWEDMVEKPSLRPDGCVLDALGIVCSDGDRIRIRHEAAAAIRRLHPSLSSSKRAWEGKKDRWSDEEIDQIIATIERVAMKLGGQRVESANQQPSESLPQSAFGEEHSTAIVHEFGKLSYNSANWEKLIADRTLKPYGCLIDSLGFKFTPAQRDLARFLGAQRLREQYPQYTNSPAAWRDKEWRPQDLAAIVAIVKGVFEEVQNGESMTARQVIATCPPQPTEIAPPGEYVAWRYFRSRAPVSDSPGVYLIAYFEREPEASVNPLSPYVIYIGIAEGNRSTGNRLEEFEQTALGRTGHSGGFTYLVEFARDVFNSDPTLLRQFHNTYCSWLDVPLTSNDSPRAIERQLLDEHQRRWGRWPRLNKRA